MFRSILKFIKRLRCRRHRWRPDRKVSGREFCDLCGARQQTP